MDAIDERIGQLVAAHRPQLEQLVHQAVDRELARLVDVEFEHRTNGTAIQGAAPARICTACGERPAAKHRTVCERCRQARARERQAAADSKPPHPAGRDQG